MSQLLIEIRGALSQTAAAGLPGHGLTQSKISRAESGKFLLDDVDEADAYAAALGATADQRRRLRELVAAHRASNVTGRKQLIRSGHVLQRRIGALELETRLLRSWVPDVIPGLLQTPAYTRAVIGADPDDRWWNARHARLAVLDDPHRELHIITAESVLRWGIGSHEVMREQLQHLRELAQRPTVRLGLVALDRVYDLAPPRGFHVYGDATATVATDVGTTFVTEAADVTHFIEQHKQLADIAAYGKEALAAIDQIARNYSG